MIDAFLQLSLTALSLGSAYALTALGFVLVINAVGAVNFAHGEAVMIGGFVAVGVAAFLPTELLFPGLLALPAVLILMAGVGAAIALLGYFPLKNAPPVSIFISTIAIGLMFQHGATLIAGPEPQAGPALLGAGQLRVFDLILPRQQLATIIVGILLVLLTHLLLHATRFGRQLRAAAQDREMARAIGIPVTLTTLASFALASALAGAAGLMLSNQYFVTPTDGGLLMLKAYMATVIGGWGRVWGAAFGALLIAVFETLLAAWVSYLAAEALLYIAVLLILAFKPEGLFGEAEGARA